MFQKWVVKERVVLSVNGGYLFYGNTSTGVVGIQKASGGSYDLGRGLAFDFGLLGG